MALPFRIGPLSFGDRTSHELRPDPASLRIIRESAANDRNADHADDELIVRLKNGDQAALRALFDAHYDRLCEYAFRVVGSADLAESAVLDVMSSLWRRRETIRVHGSLRAYLIGAVRLRAANIARTERTERDWETRAAREDTVPGMSAHTSRPDTDAIVRDIDHAIDRAITTLPARCRAAFELAWYGGLTYGEIAGQLGISVKGVEAQMARAYRSLRVALAHLL
jgi:RNA polymerase sigma-70 factor (ECF subfamily)